MNNKYKLITTPLYYANSSPHIGHAFTTLLGDVINRLAKQKGTNTIFLTGLDEHGQKVEDAANASKLSIKHFLRDRREEYTRAFRALNIEYDLFQGTSNNGHTTFVKDVVRKLHKDGLIYKGTYTGYYSVADETFLTATQVENVEGKLLSIETRREVNIVDQEAYFLRIEGHKEWLLKKIDENDRFLEPQSKKNEVSNMLKSPEFSDLCISRNGVDWGIKLPFDKDETLYVWVDALLGYYSLTSKFFEKWNNDAELDSFHLVGKEIVKFHSVYLPIVLKEANIKVDNFSVFSHGWILMDGEKMSKSLFNTIPIEDLVKRFGVDATRYYLLYRGPIKGDTTLSEEDMKEVVESDLVNKYSNLVYRTTSMIKKYSVKQWFEFDTNWVIKDKDIKKAIDLLKNNQLDKSDIGVHNIKMIIDLFKELLSLGNMLIDTDKPWSLHKKGKIVLTEWSLFKATLISILASLVIEPVLNVQANNALDCFSVNKKEMNFFYSGCDTEAIIKKISNILKTRSVDKISTIMLFKREKK